MKNPVASKKPILTNVKQVLIAQRNTKTFQTKTEQSETGFSDKCINRICILPH